jgi:ABC-type lipoprotein release transport system permease subunit
MFTASFCGGLPSTSNCPKTGIPSLSLFRWTPLYFTVRAEGDPRSLVPAVRDMASLAAAAALGALVGLLATYLPARRAAQADPASVLRDW